MLTSRCIDRPIRPLFPAGWRYETQIIALVLSADQENDTDVLAITGASAALALSEIPFEKTIAGVRIGLVDGKYIVNPTFKQRKESKLDLVVAGSKDGLVMVEAGREGSSEEQVVEALETAHAAIKQIVAAIDDLAKEAGKTKMTVAKKEIGHDFYREVEEKVFVPLTEAMRIRGKLENYETGRPGRSKDLVASIPEGEVERKAEAKAIFKELKEKVLREEVLDARRAARRPQVRRGAADLDRDRRAAAHARLGGVHPRRNAGARHLHARHGRRCAEDRELRGRDLEELHAPLQLPAVLGRRSRLHARPRPPRSRVTARSPSAR